MRSWISVPGRIILVSVLLVLLTGILVSLISIVPMNHSVRQQTEATSIANAQARQISIENILVAYQALAIQFTSRTEIRKRLEAWQQGRLTLKDLRAYSLPRLQEPADQVEHLAAMVRISQGEVIAALGPLANHLRADDMRPTARLFELVELTMSTGAQVLIKTSAPIKDGSGKVIGHDLLFFELAGLAEHLECCDSFGVQGEMWLYQFSPPLALRLSPHAETAQAVLKEPPPIASRDGLPGSGIIKSGGKPGSVSILRAFEHADISLLVTVPERVFYAAANQNLWWIWAVIMILLVLAGVLSSQAIKPLLATLTHQTEELAHNQAELQLAASVFENTPMAITDTNLRIVRVNPALLALTGRTQAELAGVPLGQGLEITSGEVQEWLELSSKGRWQGEIRHICAEDGGERLSLLNISTVHDHAGEALYHIHVFNDITSHKKTEEQIRHLAEHDPLTGLLNRHGILSCLDGAIRQHRAFSVLFIDLDKFKPINDRYGHQAGDLVLQEVARRLQQVTREKDLIARIGGDEFLVMLETSHSKDFIGRVAGQIINLLMQPFDIGAGEVEIGASVGIAHYPRHGSTANEIIHIADQSMYAAKQRGGNRFASANGEQN
jgi:diguanylate cyclase (GGDEF)-like protein/PAS domain S-box-containing protein